MSKEQQKPKDAFDAFNTVDKLVSKPILGSDGAASWQEFRKDSKLLNSKKTSKAPLAPLKKADKVATGFSSWTDERAREVEARAEAGVAALNSGYTHFKAKDEDAGLRKERKRIEQRMRPDNSEYFIKAETFTGFKFDYVFTTRDTYGTGYYWEGSDSLKKLNGTLPNWAQSTLPTTEEGEDGDDVDGQKRDRPSETGEGGKQKKKKRKKAAPVIVEDPNNPFEQVKEAIRKRNERLGISTTNPDLPEGWEVAVDPSSKKTYYFCRSTNETRWTKPEKLPEGWNVAKTNDGKQYYYHTSGETRWERPT